MLLYFSLTVLIFLILVLGLKYETEPVDGILTEDNKKIGINNKKIHKAIASIVLLILWALTAFRGINIGNDTKVYISYFNYFSSYGVDTEKTFEKGYQYLNVGIGRISTNPQVFLVTIASLMYVGTSIFIFKRSKNILVTTCLFFCCFFSSYMNIFRQGIAMIISLFAYQNIKDNKKIRAIILILFASTFHVSALIMFLFFFKNKLLKNKKVVIATTLAIACLSATGLLDKIFVIIAPRYAHYFNSRYASSGWIFISYELIRNLLLYLFISEATKVQKELSYEEMNFILLFIFSAFAYSVNLFTRASEYFLLISTIEIPNIILYNSKIKNRKIWILLISCVLLIMFNVILLVRPDWNHLYPYEFWK